MFESTIGPPAITGWTTPILLLKKDMGVFQKVSIVETNLV
jgi:hypothetical protein